MSHRDERSNSSSAEHSSSQRSDHERIARVRRSSTHSECSRSTDPQSRTDDLQHLDGRDSRQHSVSSSPSAYSSVDDNNGASPVNNRELNGKQSKLTRTYLLAYVCLLCDSVPLLIISLEYGNHVIMQAINITLIR